MAEEILKIEHVSKKYRLGMIGGTSLRDELQRKRAARKGQEDPTKRIGQAVKGNIGDEFLALDDISFTVYQGERLGIIGHNGAGKSTLLKLIARITAPTNGSIEMSGRVATMLEVGTGFHPELTGRENIYMNGAILGMTKAEIDVKIDDIIAFAEMEKFIDTPVKRYSSGMYVKLAFAVAAHLDADIMIMDEVLAVGDMKFQQKCLGKMNDVSADKGRTVLYVSHNMNTIRYLCTRCIVLDHGKLVYDGDVDTAISIYVDMNERMKFHYDYSDVVRSGMLSRKLEFLSTDIINDRNRDIIIGEPVKLKIKCRANENIENMQIRFELKDPKDNPAGTMFCDTKISAKKGETVLLDAEIATDHLAEGCYKTRFWAFESNEFGNIRNHDEVAKGLIFEVVKGKTDLIEWNTAEGGYLNLPMLTVSSVERQ